MNILELAILKQMVGGGGGSGTDNYNDLSNLPQINGETLAGNKSSSNLGLQDEIDSDNKLASDLVDDENQENKFVTSSEKNTWNAKQNAIDSDHKLDADLVDDSESTNKFVTSTEKNTWNAKQNAIDSDHKLSSSLVSFSESEAAALASGIDSSKVEQISTNQTNILYSLNTGVKNICNPDTWILGYYLKPEDGSLIPYPGDNGITSDFIPVDYSSEDYYYISGLQNDGNNLYNVIHAFNASKQFLGRTDGTLDTTRNVYESSFTGGTPVGTGDIAYIRITQYGTSGHVTNIDTSLVMVCTGHAKEQSTAHQPFALPNYDLTQLQAEDRAALAEVVDSGAKNEFEFGEFAPGGTTITITGDAVTISGTAGWAKGSRKFRLVKNTKHIISYTITESTTNGAVIMIATQQNGGGTQYYTKYHGLRLGTDVEEFYAPVDTDLYFVCTINNSAAQLSEQVTMTLTDIMICSQADWKISQKFVPFGNDPFYQVPINHNMIYRGQNLGETLTEAQDTALSSGNFTDLYLGDYWTKSVTIPAFYEVTTAEPSDWSTNYTSYYTKSGDTYTPVSGDTAPTWAANTYYERQVPEQTVTLKAVIADFDTFYAGYASTYAGINTHHAAVIVHGFNNVVWNKTNTTAGGYVNSLIHKWLVGSVLPQIETWFGAAKVLSHQKLLTNAITGDAASGWDWSSQKISLLSENQMYGSKVWGNSKASNGGYEPGEAFKHLSVFNHIDANLLFGNTNIWLRDIASAEWATDLNYCGRAGYQDASATWGAPAALILLS